MAHRKLLFILNDGTNSYIYDPADSPSSRFQAVARCCIYITTNWSSLGFSGHLDLPERAPRRQGPRRLLDLKDAARYGGL